MQLLLINQTHPTLNLRISPILIFLLISVLLIVVFSSFTIGMEYAKKKTDVEFEQLYQDFGNQYDAKYLSQKEQLELAQSEAETHLDAMATRLSNLQSHMMRLNALGARLAQMANLNDFNFDEEHAPGIGGPEPWRQQHSFSVPDFLEALERLANDIEDRSDKLSAISTVLMNNQLGAQTTPQIAPIEDGWLSSKYGWRTDPFSGKKVFHSGVDFAGRGGSSIVAVASGIVIWSGYISGYGNIVDIDHGNGYVTRYAHNKENLARVGQRVERGDKIALMGSTGRSTGTHVHFEVLYYGKYVNPKKFIAQNQ